MDINELQDTDSTENVKVKILPDGRLARNDAARYLGMQPPTLAMWASKGKGPKSVRIAGRVFYFKSDLDAFIQDEAFGSSVLTPTIDVHKDAKPTRPTSNYSLGKSFKPDEETLGRRQKQVLELLKERGPQGATRLEMPAHFALSWAQRICELRRMGYRIVSKRERVGDSWIARYVLVSTDSGPRGVEAS